MKNTQCLYKQATAQSMQQLLCFVLFHIQVVYMNTITTYNHQLTVVNAMHSFLYEYTVLSPGSMQRQSMPQHVFL